MPMVMTSVEVDSTWNEVDLTGKTRLGVTTTKVYSCLVHLGSVEPGELDNGEGAVVVEFDKPFYVDGLDGEKLF